MSVFGEVLKWFLEAYRLADHPAEERQAHAAKWKSEWEDWLVEPPKPGGPAPTD